MLTNENHAKQIARKAGFVFASALLLAGFGLTSESRAEVISISGAAFIQQCPCAASGSLPDVKKGVLMPTDSAKLYAPVDFPFNGQRICSLSIVYQDVNAEEKMTARLMRKPIIVGADPFANPTVIASVSTASGVVTTERKQSTAKISLPVINDETGFYYVEVDAPNVNLNLVGVQVKYDKSCQ